MTCAIECSHLRKKNEKEKKRNDLQYDLVTYLSIIIYAHPIPPTNPLAALFLISSDDAPESLK